MARIKNGVFAIFWEAVKLYFTNFGRFFRYMAFPVFGQISGIIIALLSSYYYTLNVPNLIAQGGIFNNFSIIFLILILITLPGLFIFMKAFWDYLVAYGAINSMADNLVKSGKVYDFAAHNEVITRRTSAFIGLWLLFALFTIAGIFPLFLLAAGILFVYFVLIFQVFTFEPDKSPVGCFKKSFNIIKGNFRKTCGLMLLLLIFTYWVLPETVKFLFDAAKIIALFAIPLDGWASQFPIDEINKLLMRSPTAYQITSLLIARFAVSAFLGYAVIGLTLPLRSICWALWYKMLNKGEAKLDKKILNRAEAKD